jgi:hypothetical protein
VRVTDQLESLDETFNTAPPSDTGQDQERVSPPFAYAQFDLSRDLTPQFEEAKRRVKQLQTRMKQESGLHVSISKPQKGKWQLYLRVLDAMESVGVVKGSSKWKQVARVLLPRKRKDKSTKDRPRRARDTHRQAMNMARTGYRALIR